MGGTTNGEGALIGVETLLIIVGCTIKFGDGGIRGWGIVILLVCTVGDARVVLILMCEPTGVFIGTAFTSICRPPPIGLGVEVDVSGGGSVPVWDAIGGWIRIEPILLTVVRPVGVCTLTGCCNFKKYNGLNLIKLTMEHKQERYFKYLDMSLGARLFITKLAI